MTSKTAIKQKHAAISSSQTSQYHYNPNGLGFYYHGYFTPSYSSPSPYLPYLSSLSAQLYATALNESLPFSPSLSSV